MRATTNETRGSDAAMPKLVARVQRISAMLPGLAIVSAVLASSVARAQGWQYQPNAGFTSGEVASMCEYDPDGPGGAPKMLVAIGTFTESSSGVSGLNGVAAWNGTDWQPLGTGLSPVFDADGNSWNGILAWDPDGSGPLPTHLMVRSRHPFSFGGGPGTYGAYWDGTSWRTLSLPGGGTNYATVHDPDGDGSLPTDVYVAGPAGVFRVNLSGPPTSISSNWIDGAFCSIDPDGDGPTQPVLVIALQPNSFLKWDGTEWTPMVAPPTLTPNGLIAVDLDGVGPLPKQLVQGCFGNGTGIYYYVWSPGLTSVSTRSFPVPPGWNIGLQGGLGVVDLDGAGPKPPALCLNDLVKDAYYNHQTRYIAVDDGDGCILAAQSFGSADIGNGYGSPRRPRGLVAAKLDSDPNTPPELFVYGNVSQTPPGQPTSYGVLRRKKVPITTPVTWTYGHSAQHTCYLGVDCGVGHGTISSPAPLPTGGADSDALNYSNGSLAWSLPIDWTWAPGCLEWRSYNATLLHGTGFAGWLTPTLSLQATAYAAVLPGTRCRIKHRSNSFLTGTGNPALGSLAAVYNVNAGLDGYTVEVIGAGSNDLGIARDLVVRRYDSTVSLPTAEGDIVFTSLGSFSITLGGHQNVFPPSGFPTWLGQWNSDGEFCVSIEQGTPPYTQVSGSGTVPGGAGQVTLTATAEDGDGSPTGANGHGITYYEWTLDGQRVLGGATETSYTATFTSAGAHTIRVRVFDDEGQFTSVTRQVGACDAAPILTSSPASMFTCLRQDVSLSVVTSSAQPAEYHWRKNGIAIDAGSNSSASASTLVLTGVIGTDAGIYDCVISNACGSATSNPATLTICVADTDDGSGTGACDGGVTIDDLLYYLFIFEVGELAADVDDGSGGGTPDGGVTIDDLLYYLVRFEAGC